MALIGGDLIQPAGLFQILRHAGAVLIQHPKADGGIDMAQGAGLLIQRCSAGRIAAAIGALFQRRGQIKDMLWITLGGGSL